jgi:hypothetical protein
MVNGVCGISASSPRQLGAWVYVLVAFGIIGGECHLVSHVLLIERMTRYGGRALLFILYTQETTYLRTWQARAILARTGSFVTFTPSASPNICF